MNFCFIYFVLHVEQLSFYFQYLSFNCNFDFFNQWWQVIKQNAVLFTKKLLCGWVMTNKVLIMSALSFIFKYLLRMWLAFWCSIPHMFLYYNFFCTCFRIRHNAYKRYFLVTGYFSPKFSIDFCSSLNSVSYELMTACFLYDGAFCLIFFPELFFSFLNFLRWFFFFARSFPLDFSVVW